MQVPLHIGGGRLIVTNRRASSSGRAQRLAMFRRVERELFAARDALEARVPQTQDAQRAVVMTRVRDFRPSPRP